MGRDKAFLETDGRPLIQHSLETLGKVCREVVISAGKIEPYSRFGVPVVRDIYPGQGPLGGLISVFEAISCDLLFLAACDMPFLREDAIRYIYAQMSDYDIVVPETGGKLHTLHALYHRRTASAAASVFQSGKRSLACLMQTCRVCVLKPNAAEIGGTLNVSGAGGGWCVKPVPEAWSVVLDRSVINVNTQEEWTEALRLETLLN
jgi:molybdopterin-guanine dinucleotide biosynthesis protein A